MDKVKFSQDDENAREIVRAIFFQCLKKEMFVQLPYDISQFRTIVDFEGHQHTTESKFLLLLHNWRMIYVYESCAPTKPHEPHRIT